MRTYQRSFNANTQNAHIAKIRITNNPVPSTDSRAQYSPFKIFVIGTNKNYYYEGIYRVFKYSNNSGIVIDKPFNAPNGEFNIVFNKKDDFIEIILASTKHIGNIYVQPLPGFDVSRFYFDYSDSAPDNIIQTTTNNINTGTTNISPINGNMLLVYGNYELHNTANDHIIKNLPNPGFNLPFIGRISSTGEIINGYVAGVGNKNDPVDAIIPVAKEGIVAVCFILPRYTIEL